MTRSLISQIHSLLNDGLLRLAPIQVKQSMPASKYPYPKSTDELAAGRADRRVSTDD